MGNNEISVCLDAWKLGRIDVDLVRDDGKAGNGAFQVGIQDLSGGTVPEALIDPDSLEGEAKQRYVGTYTPSGRPGYLVDALVKVGAKREDEINETLAEVADPVGYWESRMRPHLIRLFAIREMIKALSIPFVAVGTEELEAWHRQHGADYKKALADRAAMDAEMARLNAPPRRAAGRGAAWMNAHKEFMEKIDDGLRKDLGYATSASGKEEEDVYHFHQFIAEHCKTPEDLWRAAAAKGAPDWSFQIKPAIPAAEWERKKRAGTAMGDTPIPSHHGWATQQDFEDTTAAWL